MPLTGTRATSSSESEVRDLYDTLIDAWNRRDAQGFAACFTDDGHTVGFDGSTLDGLSEIEQSLRAIFVDHPTASYVTKVREVSFPSTGTGLLRVVVGMVPAGENDLNPAVNAIQSMVAVQQDGSWRIALLQNTPAAFHGRPELVESQTQELREVLAAR